MEAAVAKADSDEAQLTLAQRKAQAAFGLNPPWDSGGRRARIMADLSSGRLALVRVIFPLGALAGGLPQSLSLTRLSGSQRWTSRQLWRAPADPAFPGQGIFTLVAGSDLAQNDHVTAYVPAGAPEAGVKVPATAVVYGEGESWIYVRKGNDNFQRVRLDTARMLDESYFVPKRAGIAPGDPIVTSGAGLLLARELNPSTEAGD
jgi:multidrug efflux pump subunit AcrA (membrane-fusion protein)